MLIGLTGRLSSVGASPPRPHSASGGQHPVAVERTDAIIAGVNKAGHDVAVRVAVDASRRRAVVDQGDALLPARALRHSRSSRSSRTGTGTSPTPVTGRCTSRRPRRTSTAAERVAAAHARPTWSNPHALLVLREPVSRAISFFTYQKIRLRFPADYPIERLPGRRRRARPPTTSSTPRTRSTWRSGAAATPTSCPAWLDTLGTERMHVIGFEQLVDDPADDAA